MARYRSKDETDLRWNRIRRRLTRELDTQIADFRDEALNTLLTGAWEEYVNAISTGKKLEIESEYSDWVGRALQQTVTIDVNRDALAD